MRHWMNTISLEHVEIARAGGFTQADHGRSTRLTRLARGDRLVFYSPRTAMGGGQPLQRFTALGEVVDDEPFQVEMAPDFHPWRRRVDFEDVGSVPIRPLLEQLSITRGRRGWGMVFRRGLFEVPPDDFAVVADAMRSARHDPPDAQGPPGQVGPADDRLHP